MTCQSGFSVRMGFADRTRLDALDLIQGRDVPVEAQPQPRPLGQVAVVPCKCKHWACPRCAGGVAAREVEKLKVILCQFRRIIMVTFTVDPGRLGSPQRAFEYVTKNRCLTEAIKKLERRIGHKFKWISALQFQTNGNLHYHVLVDTYIRKADLVWAWTRQLPSGLRATLGFVDIRCFDSEATHAGNALQAARYVSRSGYVPDWVLDTKRFRRITKPRNRPWPQTTSKPGRRYVKRSCKPRPRRTLRQQIASCGNKSVVLEQVRDRLTPRYVATIDMTRQDVERVSPCGITMNLSGSTLDDFLMHLGERLGRPIQVLHRDDAAGPNDQPLGPGQPPPARTMSGAPEPQCLGQEPVVLTQGCFTPVPPSGQVATPEHSWSPVGFVTPANAVLQPAWHDHPDSTETDADGPSHQAAPLAEEDCFSDAELAEFEVRVDWVHALPPDGFAAPATAVPPTAWHGHPVTTVPDEDGRFVEDTPLAEEDCFSDVELADYEGRVDRGRAVPPDGFAAHTAAVPELAWPDCPVGDDPGEDGIVVDEMLPDEACFNEDDQAEYEGEADEDHAEPLDPSDDGWFIEEDIID